MTRFLTGLLAIGAVIAVALAVTPPAETLRPVPVTETDVFAADLPSACPGWLHLPVGESEGSATEGDGLDPNSGHVTRSMYTSGGDTPEKVGVGYSTSSDVATSIERIGRGDLAGLSAATCTEPMADSWLVGGSTRLGSSARLVVVNPTSVDAEVVATVYGPTGEFDAPIILSLGAHSSESLLLEGVAAELATLVVHVEASGAGVVALIQDSRLDGFLPAGSDWVAAGAGPTNHVIIPGVGPSRLDASSEGAEGDPATVRLMAPDGANVALTGTDAEGPIPWPGVKALVLEPGVVVDVDLPESGMSTIVVSSDRPVVAAAISRVSRPPEEGLEGDLDRDIAWVAGREAVAPPGLVAVVPPYTVWLVAYSGEQSLLRVSDASTGTEIAAIVVAAGTTTALPLAVREGTLMTVEGATSWVLRVEDAPGFITAVRPIDVKDYGERVRVAPGVYLP